MADGSAQTLDWTGFDQDIIEDIWREKYRFSDEETPLQSHRRVADAIYENDPDEKQRELAYEALVAGRWMPGGRIHAGAGTPRDVTLINCYVSPAIGDSHSDVADALRLAMLTMHQGGGIGMDFSTLRPKGAEVTETATSAAGPVAFMGLWDAMCATIMSSGSRRGAMMATLADNHPDLMDFIRAKQGTGRLTNFNLSVLVSDDFMEAVRNDGQWDLGFSIPPSSKPVDKTTTKGSPWYIYERLSARDLWKQILRSTYEHSEPGVIFIDRVNASNNLGYCEEIRATNPCGEQPLPPHGACNLGHVNLARMVKNPFSENATIDHEAIRETTRIGVRFLDNVVDVSRYPTDAQKSEEESKRRTGLGVAGLANMLQQLCIVYGSPESVDVTDAVMKSIKVEAYRTSVELARERGSFPEFARDEFLSRPFVKELPEDIRAAIGQYGIRNGVLLTVAPTGTTSIYYGNISGGIEPVLFHNARRSVLTADGSTKSYTVEDYGYQMYRTQLEAEGEFDENDLPDYMVISDNLDVEAHLRIQAACQRHVDASISKTINCHPEMEFDDFASVYDRAYDLGCKGCTTFRPSKTIEGVIKPLEGTTSREILPRPPALSGKTTKFKLDTPDNPHAFYITINDTVDPETGQKRPFEIFAMTKNGKFVDWTTALTLMISAIFRRTSDVAFVAEELKQVFGQQTAFRDGEMVSTPIQVIGQIIDEHLVEIGLVEKPKQKGLTKRGDTVGAICPQCNTTSFHSQEGCATCWSCGYSNCS